MGDKSDAFDNALDRVQSGAAVLGEIGLAAVERFVLIRNAELAEITKVLESFADQKRDKSRIDHRGIDRTCSHAGNSRRHRAALHVSDIVALRVELEVIEPDGDGRVR